MRNFLLPFLLIIPSSASVLYNDGQSHSIQTSLNDAVTLRSSSALILPSGDYAIRSSPGTDAGIRLYMSSTLNATGGDIIGADASADHPVASAGVIVGSASRAIFWDGATVRGGSHLGTASVTTGKENINAIRSTTTYNVRGSDNNDAKGQGGDALISQYLGSNVTIHGGSFLAGRGSISDGHSLRASYEGAEIHVLGGTYYGSWMAKDGGTIVAYGCLSRIGSRLVGRLGEDGHRSLDVQIFEEGGGKVVVDSPESCNRYRRKDDSPASSAVRVGLGGTPLVLGLVVLIMCGSFALV